MQAVGADPYQCNLTNRHQFRKIAVTFEPILCNVDAPWDIECPNVLKVPSLTVWVWWRGMVGAKPPKSWVTAGSEEIFALQVFQCSLFQVKYFCKHCKVDVCNACFRLVGRDPGADGYDDDNNVDDFTDDDDDNDDDDVDDDNDDDNHDVNDDNDEHDDDDNDDGNDDDNDDDDNDNGNDDSDDDDNDNNDDDDNDHGNDDDNDDNDDDNADLPPPVLSAAVTKSSGSAVPSSTAPPPTTKLSTSILSYKCPPAYWAINVHRNIEL